MYNSVTELYQFSGIYTTQLKCIVKMYLFIIKYLISNMFFNFPFKYSKMNEML